MVLLSTVGKGFVSELWEAKRESNLIRLHKTSERVMKELESRIGLSIIVPPEPQIVGALGAALLARDKPNQ